MIPPLHADYVEMWSALNDAGVDWLLVGGYAVGIHGYPRATKDLDIWIRPTPENARRVVRALVAFGAPSPLEAEAGLAREGFVVQIGAAPVRIDILTSVSGLTFEDAWEHREHRVIAGVPVHLISMRDLLTNKRACGRLQDLADVEKLELHARLAAKRRGETP
jgi:hypothetical protein